MTVVKRKLIEVALPLEAINRESAREKSIRVGHPSTMHLWWARRPLAACRAVLFAQLVDDPSSRPDEFPTEADQARERQRLFDLIERLVVWENMADEGLIAEARVEIMRSTGGNPPTILDPFAGGGSIPLEAQRLGLRVDASDLNPVAVLINRALIEIPPRVAGQAPSFPGAAESRLGGWPGASGLAEDVRRYGGWLHDEAERRLSDLYPKATLPNGSTATVIAWIWCRTVTCTNPACGVEMPLVRSWWLGKKKGKETFIVPAIVLGQDGSRRVDFTIAYGIHGPTKDEDGTVDRTGAQCISCKTSVPLAYIRTEGKAHRMGARLMAIVAEGDRRRIYLPPTVEHERAAEVAFRDDVPDTELPHNPWSLKTPNYGLTSHRDLFSARQQNLLATLALLIRDLAGGQGPGDDIQRKRDVAVYLASTLARVADYSSTVTTWASHPKMEALRNTFARQSIPMAWDYAEGNPWSGSSGNLRDSVKYVADVVERLPAGPKPGQATQRDATTRQMHGALLCTDPPYYDNVDYADLSDFFYLWERMALSGVEPDLYGTVVTPKADEMVANPYRFEGNRGAARSFFQARFARFAKLVSDGSDTDAPAAIFYAFRQTEGTGDDVSSTGWETMLQGLFDANLAVVATWPVRSEMSARILARETNALASSVVLAVRPRRPDSVATNRKGFIGSLKAELPRALRELQQGSIAPVDLAQAAIGPGMSIFSRHTRVVEADGSSMTVRTALALINQVLDEVLTEQEGDFDADTRFCVKWFSQFGWNEGTWGQADVLARATNTSVEGVVNGGVFWAAAGKARLLAPGDLDNRWDPQTDERISDWEVVLRLCRAVSENGSDDASKLMSDASTRIDLDTAKELAYLLYSVSEKKGWSQTAVLFNALGTSWSDLVAGSRTSRLVTGDQGEFDLEGDK